MEKIMEDYCFSYPKPVSLIKYLLSLIYDKETESFPNNYTVLDFFSGSGTTAQAIIELNEQDKGNRKFIMVQKPEIIEQKNSTKYTTLCDIGEERIRRCIKAHSKSENAGFKVFISE